jgi:hypothetical protein
MLYVLPTFVFMVIFWLGLGYKHLHSPEAEKRKTEITYTFPEGIEDRDAPFPLSMLLIIAGTLIWAFFYILGTGLLGVKI